MVEDDLGERPREIEFTLGKTFYDSGDFRDAFNEFSTVNNFALKHVKTDS